MNFNTLSLNASIVLGILVSTGTQDAASLEYKAREAGIDNAAFNRAMRELVIADRVRDCWHSVRTGRTRYDVCTFEVSYP